MPARTTSPRFALRRPAACFAVALCGWLMLTNVGDAIAGPEGFRAPRAARMSPARGGFANRPMRAERFAGPRGAMPREPAAAASSAPPDLARPTEAPQPLGRPGRLTPDERRALRQQINDAGRDIYRAPRP